MILLFISKVILDFICKYKEIFIYLGKPLIYIQESNQYHSSNNREFECQVYSSSPILVIKINRSKNYEFYFIYLEN